MGVFDEKSVATPEALKAEYPGVYEQVRALGKAEERDGIGSEIAASFDKGKTEGQATGEIIGAKNELARILAIEEVVVPGNEALIKALKADGKTTGPEAAVKIIKAENAKRAKGLETLEEEAGQPAGASIEEQPPSGAAKTPKEKWDADAGLRAEYGDDFGAYESYVKAVAGGRVKVFGEKRA